MTRRPALIFVSVVAIAVAVAIYFLVQRGPRPQSAPEPANTVSPGTVTYDTWNDFLARRDGADGAPSERQRVVFIGVDGARWSIIDPMIDEGILPTFARLKAEGCYGILRSVDCYVSPPAWVSMMTGYRPEKTGIYTFAHWDRSENEFLPLSSWDVEVPSVWDVASIAGKRTAIVNVPMTYPVRELNGLMLSGLLTPIAAAERAAIEVTMVESANSPADAPTSFAPVLTGETVHAGNTYTFHIFDTTDDGETQYDRMRTEVHPASGANTTVHWTRYGYYSPWTQVECRENGAARKGWVRYRLRPRGKPSVYLARFTDTLLSLRDAPEGFVYPDTVVDALEAEFPYYFPSKFLDPEVVPEFTKDAARFASFFYRYDDWDLFAYVFTETDNMQHLEGVTDRTRMIYRIIDGFLGELLGDIDANTTLIIASDHGFKKHASIIDINKLFEQVKLLRYGPNRTIDYANSLAFHNLWCIYFNRELLTRDELQRRGMNVPEGMSPADFLASYIQGIDITIPRKEGNLSFPLEFKRVGADAVGYAPDLIVTGTYSDYMVEFWNLRKPGSHVARPLRPGEAWHHTPDGIYLVYGPNVHAGVDGGMANIEDIAPTMLHVLGLPAGADMDGLVMTQVFGSPGEFSSVAEYTDIPRHSAVPDRQREDLEKKLRSLGYIR